MWRERCSWVRHRVARAQIQEETPVASAAGREAAHTEHDEARSIGDTGGVPAPLALPNHFYADVDVDALRFGRDAAQIADAIITHLNGLIGAKVTVSLQIEARVPDGVPENVQRTVSENCRTLKIHFEFDQR